MTRALGTKFASTAVRYWHPLAQRGGRAGSGIWRFLGPDRPISEEAEPGEAGATSRDERMARMEAILLLAREPLGTRKIGKLAGLADGTEARTLIRRLNQFYDQQGCAFRVEEVAGGHQLLTRPQYGVWLRRLRGARAEVRLSGPALETLAVVAYRQPVLRADIEAIRGVQCGEMLRQLMERELVRQAGRADELGRPFLYGTTRHFLEIFGLRDLDELPRADVLRGPGLPSSLANVGGAGVSREHVAAQADNANDRLRGVSQ